MQPREKTWCAQGNLVEQGIQQSSRAEFNLAGCGGRRSLKMVDRRKFYETEEFGEYVGMGPTLCVRLGCWSSSLGLEFSVWVRFARPH